MIRSRDNATFSCLRHPKPADIAELHGPDLGQHVLCQSSRADMPKPGVPTDAAWGIVELNSKINQVEQDFIKK